MLMDVVARNSLSFDVVKYENSLKGGIELSYIEIISLVLCIISIITYGVAGYKYYNDGDILNPWIAWFSCYFLCVAINWMFAFSHIFNHTYEFNPTSLTCIIAYITTAPMILGRACLLADDIRLHFYFKKQEQKKES